MLERHRRLGWRRALAILVALTLFPTLAAADPFVLVDPGSTVYNRFAVIANDEIKVDKDTTIVGDVHGNDEIELKSGSRVEGDVSAVDEIDADGTVTGQITENAPLVALPSLPPEAELRALADRVFEDDTDFEDAVIDDIVFVDGDVEIEGDFGGRGTIIASGEIRLKKDGGLEPATSRVSLIAYEEIRLDKNRTFRGVLRSADEIRLDKETVFDGVLVADGEIEIKKDARITFEDFDVVVGPDDTVPPQLTVTAPEDTVVGDDTPEIVLTYSDNQSGVNPATLDVTLDGVSITADCTVGQQLATCEPPPLAEGAHAIDASISDVAGNVATVVSSFELVAETATDTLDLTAIADTYLEESAPDLRHGGEATLRQQGGARTRTLVRFDQAALDAALDGVTLVSATLELFIEQNDGGWGATGRSVGAHRVFAEWSEQQATWTTPGSDDPEIVPEGWIGGSANIVPVGTALHSDGQLGPVTFDVTRDLIEVQNGDPHLGWLLQNAEETLGGGVVYTAREGAPEQAPRLRLVLVPTGGDDTTPPRLTVPTPVEERFILDDTSPAIGVAFSDAESGVDLGSLVVAVDGIPLEGCTVTAEDASCEPFELAPGVHQITARIRDLAGNLAGADREIELVSRAPGGPVVTIDSPVDDFVTFESTVVVNGQVTSDEPVVTLTANGQPITLTDGAWSASVALAEGDSVIEIAAVDALGRQDAAAIGVTVDRTPPTLSVDSPRPNQIFNSPSVLVTGEVDDEFGIASFEVAGNPVAIVDDEYEVMVDLAEGTNRLTVRATDFAGNVTEISIDVFRRVPIELAISGPADGTLTSAQDVLVTGSVSDPAATVEVDGVAAQVTGNSWNATVPLSEGLNLLTAVATDGGGGVGTATTSVLRDTTEPSVVIAQPRDGSVTREDTIAVMGMVNDRLRGTGEAPLAITVNGQPATLTGQSFLVEGLALEPGDNTVTVEALDAAGNRGSASISVRFDNTASATLRVVSGDGQSGAVGGALPAPLVARVTDLAGQPVPNQAVHFQVSRGDGSLTDGLRQQIVTSDADGRASVPFTLGSDAGAGNHIVEASAPGFAGPATFIASAQPLAPASLIVDAGDQQVGATDARLPMPFVALVTDESFNGLPGVPVRFNVVDGDGRFDNGLTEITTVSDSDGRVEATLTLGSTEGVRSDAVWATFADIPDGPIAGFTASAMAVGDPALTSIVGVVLDNTDEPVPGVTMSVDGTTVEAVTDEDGFFRIEPAPVGTLLLHAEGTTATRDGTWPNLEFVLTTVPGRENDLGRPIYLLPIRTDQSVTVSETEGGTLVNPDLPGFALTIEPGSATFADGGKRGSVSATVVHYDKVPMAPNAGMQPRLVVTIQPEGTSFDPPARLTLPNTAGLAPGDETDFFSFDHDLGRFVSVGPGVVSEDGLTVTSEPGFGIVKAGWHCGDDPNSSGTTHDCPDCKKCEDNVCVKDLSQDGSDCTKKFRRPGRVCRDGKCVCAKPVNFQVDNVRSEEGHLIFEYTYESSTGEDNNIDLAKCTIEELVDYPGSDDPFVPPAPFVTQLANPTKMSAGSGAAGWLSDVHFKPGIAKPYTNGCFTAKQKYRYRCICTGINRPRTIQGGIRIQRCVSQLGDGRFLYTINKSGFNASMILPD